MTQNLKAGKSSIYRVPTKQHKLTRPPSLTEQEVTIWKAYIDPAPWLCNFDTAAAVAFCKLYSVILTEPRPASAVYVNLSKISDSLYLNPYSRDRAAMKVEFNDQVNKVLKDEI